MEDFILMSSIALILATFIASGAITLIVSVLIIHYLPNTKAAKWLNEIWLDEEETPDEIFNAKVGDCITKKVTK